MAVREVSVLASLKARPVSGALALIFLFFCFATANYISFLRLSPELSSTRWIVSTNSYDEHVVNIHQRAELRSHGSPESFLPIYDIQHPGFFLLAAEMFSRAEATTPRPLEITSIVLYNIGAVCFFWWVFLLFENFFAAVAATAFLVLSRFFLFFPGVTHTFPYEFVFFNVTLLFFLLFLRGNDKRFLIAALVAMFMTCMNYWFYYLSSWIIMTGLWWQYRGRPRLRDVALLSAPPVLAATLTAALTMVLFGVKAGFFRLLDVFVARTMDIRLPQGQWWPDKKFMTALDWVMYPATLATRLATAFSINFALLSLAVMCTLLLLSFYDRRSFTSALILLLGGFAWYFVMVQHTHIHVFAGQYSFMAICPLLGLMASAIPACAVQMFETVWQRNGSNGNWRAPWEVAAIALISALLAVSSFTINTYRLVTETVSLSLTVEDNYKRAVRDICQQRGKITVGDLRTAAQDWAFQWNPELLAATNQMPTCRGDGT